MWIGLGQRETETDHIMCVGRSRQTPEHDSSEDTEEKHNDQGYQALREPKKCGTDPVQDSATGSFNSPQIRVEEGVPARSYPGGQPKEEDQQVGQYIP